MKLKGKDLQLIAGLIIAGIILFSQITDKKSKNEQVAFPVSALYENIQ